MPKKKSLTYREALSVSQWELEEFQKQLINDLVASYKVPPRMLGAARGLGKTTAAATTAMAAAAWPYYVTPIEPCPWPYGTVIKPTLMNTTFPEEARHMVVAGYEAGGTMMTISLDPDIDDDVRRYIYLVEDIHERWEIAEEAP